jgi:hypothetical protein
MNAKRGMEEFLAFFHPHKASNREIDDHGMAEGRGSQVFVPSV